MARIVSAPAARSPRRRPTARPAALLLLLWLFAGLCTLPAPASSGSCFDAGWPQDDSDLAPDPAVRFGRLANGMRYLILAHRHPRDRVALYLRLAVGSLHEKASERGVAHFLEHMVFNGTTHFPPGQLVRFFQAQGMDFGADSNAHTAYDETVYKLYLPGRDPARIDEALLVLADYVQGALLEEEEVARERGVILAERRTRDSASYRVWRERMRFLYAGTRVAERAPIGTVETIERTDAQTLRRFYRRWYRPEAATLLVVGDVDVPAMETVIRRRFSGWRGQDPPPRCPDPGRVAASGWRFFHHHEGELEETRVELAAVWNEPFVRDDAEYERRWMRRYLAHKMIGYRLAELVEDHPDLLTGADAYATAFLRRYGEAHLVLRGRPGQWRRMAALLATAYRQALDQGFTETELDRARKEILATLRTAEARRRSMDSDRLAARLTRVVGAGEVVRSPAQELAFFEPVLHSTGLEQVHEAFAGIWRGPGLAVLVTGATGMESLPTGRAEETIRDQWRRFLQATPPPYRPRAASRFPYLPPASGEAAVERVETADAIGARIYHFSGGQVLQVKRTDFEPGTFYVQAAFGYGRLEQPGPGYGPLAEAVVEGSGTGRLTRQQLAAVLAPYRFRFRFTVQEDAFVLRARGVTDEIEAAFEMLRTLLADPGFREEAMVQAKQRYRQEYEAGRRQVEGILATSGRRWLAGGSGRYGAPTPDEVDRISLDRLRAWLEPRFRHAPLELSVVGDVDESQVVRLTASLLAARPVEPLPEPRAGGVRFPSGQRFIERPRTAVDKALVAVAWPSTDLWHIDRNRLMHVLGGVLAERMRERVREELGFAYSTWAYQMAGRSDPGYGYLLAGAIVAPAQAPLVESELRRLATGLAEAAPSEEEVQRVVRPILTSVRDRQQDNRYWLETVFLLASRHPQQRIWPTTILEGFGSITARQVHQAAREVFQPSHAAVLRVVPARPAKPASGVTR